MEQVNFSKEEKNYEPRFMFGKQKYFNVFPFDSFVCRIFCIKTIAVVIGLSFFSSIKAQEQLVHEKKIYLSPEGKLFCNKKLPVYFYVSTSSSPNAPHYLLKSETTPKCANPMYFDTEGRNTLRSPSAVDTVTKKLVLPKQDVQFQLYIDSKPPSTKIVFDKNREHVKKGLHYIPDSVTISFDGNDELSGVENIYISVDNSAYKALNAPLKLDSEKEYTVKYYAVDHTGNVEKPKEIKFYIDKTSPKCKLDILGQNFQDILPANTLLQLTAEDNIAGVKQIYFSLDDSIFKTYTGKINTNNIAEGGHKLFYYATDLVNHKENVSTYSFYVDKTPPQVIEEVMGKTFVANGKEFSAGTSKLKITSFDNKAGVKDIFYSINNSEYVKYEKPIILSGYKGDLQIKSYAVDNVGNQSHNDMSGSRKNGIPYIDLSAPWVGHDFKGPTFLNRDTTFISKKTHIILEAKDDESGIERIEYQVNSNDLIKYGAPFTLSNEGYYHISVYGYDNTENLTKQEFGIQVDSTGPEIYERFSTAPIGSIDLDGQHLSEYPGHAVIFLSATDLKSGFESMSFQLNNNPMQPYVREVKGFISGKNTLRIKSFDKLSNSTEKIIEFYVK